MATEDEIQNIILQVINKKDLDAVNEALALEVTTMQRLIDQYRLGTINQAQFEQSSENVAKTMAVQKAEITKLTVALDELEGAGGGFKMRGGMRADLILTHAFRELTSETATLTEKLERLSMVTPWILNMFGVSGPWVLGLALGTTAVIELYTHWNELMSALGNDAPLEAAKKIEEMAKRTMEAVNEFKKNLGIPTPDEADIMNVFKKEGQGTKGVALLNETITSMLAAGQGVPAAAKDEDIPWKFRFMDPAVRKLIPAINVEIEQNRAERVKQENIDKAKRLISEAHAGKTMEEREEAQTTLRGLLPGRFGDLDVDTQRRQGEASDAAQAEFDKTNTDWKQGKAVKAKRDHADKVHDQVVDQFEDQARHAIAQRETQKQHAVQQRLHKNEQEEKRRPMDLAAQHMALAASRGGFSPYDSEVHEMAQTFLHLSNAGYGTQEATLGAINKAIIDAQQLQMRYFSQMNRANALMTGPDQSAVFSQISPQW